MGHTGTIFLPKRYRSCRKIWERRHLGNAWRDVEIPCVSLTATTLATWGARVSPVLEPRCRREFLSSPSLGDTGQRRCRLGRFVRADRHGTARLGKLRFGTT